MDSECANCISLNEQCLQLKYEIANLSKKLDNLLEQVFHEKVDMSTQTNLQFCFDRTDSSTQSKMKSSTSVYTH